MPKDFTATIATDSARHLDWLHVYGTNTVYIRSPIPKVADLPQVGRREIYELDLDLLTAEQRQRLVEYIAATFDLAPADVEADLDAEGMPILADDVYITIHNPQKWV